MRAEATRLIGVKKTKHQWDEFEEVVKLSNKFPIHDGRCHFYYRESGLVYTEYVEKKVAYTYIAKADGLNFYKVGRTKNLLKRMRSLKNDYPYSLLTLTVIAFSPVDCEKILKVFFSCDASTLPKPFNKAEELLLLDDTELLKILDMCSFTRINTNEQMPETITRITKQYYDSMMGNAIYRKYNYRFD